MQRRKVQVAVVDGANVAHAEKTRDGKPKCSNITAMRALLQKRHFKPIVIADAALRHDVDDPQQFESLVDKQTIRQAPAGVRADYFVLRTAEEEEGVVVSNDTYREFRDSFGWIEERRVPFMIVEGKVQLYQPKLAKAAREDEPGESESMR